MLSSMGCKCAQAQPVNLLPLWTNPKILLRFSRNVNCCPTLLENASKFTHRKQIRIVFLKIYATSIEWFTGIVMFLPRCETRNLFQGRDGITRGLNDICLGQDVFMKCLKEIMDKITPINNTSDAQINKQRVIIAACSFGSKITNRSTQECFVPGRM